MSYEFILFHCLLFMLKEAVNCIQLRLIILLPLIQNIKNEKFVAFFVPLHSEQASSTRSLKWQFNFSFVSLHYRILSLILSSVTDGFAFYLYV